MSTNTDTFGFDLKAADRALLAALTEYLRTPLVQIAYSAELARFMDTPNALQNIEQIARSAMIDMDSLLLGLKAVSGQLELQLKPLAPAAVLSEAEYQLQAFADRYGCLIETEFRIPKRHLAFVHAGALTHAVRSLCQLLIKLVVGYVKSPKLLLRSEIVNGHPLLTLLLKGDIAPLITDLQKQIRSIKRRDAKYGHHQLLLGGPAAGWLVSSQILNTMGASIRLHTRGGDHGFQIRLQSSSQLALGAM